MADRDWEAELKAMAEKNAELIGEVRDSKAALRKFDNIDIDALNDAAKELETLKVAKQKEVGEFKALYEGEVEAKKKLAADLESAKGDLTGLMTRQQIDKALPPRTFPELRGMAVDDIYRRATLEKDGSVVVEGMPVVDFVKTWQETPVGKHFIAAEENSGGGAQGSRGVDKDEALKFFIKGKPTYNMTEVGRIQRTNPARAEKLQKAAAKLAESE